MLLAEDQLALGALCCPPMREMALQGAQQPIGKAARMGPLQLLQHGRGADAGCAIEDRHHLLRQTSWNGSTRVRYWRGGRWLAHSRRPVSVRRALLSMKPAFAAATARAPRRYARP
jgi:hypothetical protein